MRDKRTAKTASLLLGQHPALTTAPPAKLVSHRALSRPPAAAGSSAGAAGATAEEKEGADTTTAADASPSASKTETDNAGGAESIKSKEKDFDQTRFEDFPQVVTQERTFWDCITPEQLVWHLDCPAIVVPERDHFCLPVDWPNNGVMVYGPAAKGVEPSRKREEVCLQACG